MNKNIRKILSLLLAVPVWGGFLLASSAGQDITLRFLEGIKEGVSEAPAVVTSSYLKPTVKIDIESAPDLGEVIQQVKKVFNLKDVRLITEAGLDWPQSGDRQVSHILRLDSKQYHLRMTATGPDSEAVFRLQIEEQTDDKKSGLLDSEFLLPSRHTAVFGFEDAMGKPYFISVYGILGAPSGGVQGGVKGGVGEGVSGGVKSGVAGQEPERRTRSITVYTADPQGMEKFAKGSSKAEGDVKPPKLVKQVQPVYPEESRKDDLGGLVILEAKTDKAGRVIDARVLKVILDVPEEKANDKALLEKHRRYFEDSALEAVKSWLYEPMSIKGKPYGVVFTVTVRYRLKH